MLNRIESTIRRYGLIKEGDGVVCGVSGGADSVALLSTLLKLSTQIGFTVYAAHLNHSIRGESAVHDELFVAELCDMLGVPLYRETIDVPKAARDNQQTLEQAGRIMRYDFLGRAMRHFGATSVAVAHHMDDQAESILMHMFRGSGLLGLTGMQPRRGDVIRPMLFLRRSEIEEYLDSEGIAFCTDETNLLPEGTRNRLRLDVIPYIEENVNSAIVPTLCSMAELLLRDEEYLDGEARKALASAKRDMGYVRLVLRDLPMPILTRALRIAMRDAGAKTDIERVHVESVIELLSARTGARLKLPYIDAWTSYELICFGVTEQVEEFSFPLSFDGETITPLGVFRAEVGEAKGNYTTDRSVACMDLDKLPDDIVVRTRLSGDRFFPVNAPGSKKLKDFFIDRKVPRNGRILPLIASGDEILFVPGFCISDSVKVDGDTKHILRVAYFDAREYKKK